MRVGITYADASAQVWLSVEVADDATVRAAIDASGILASHPQIDLASQKVGVFGKFVALDAPLQPGDRVEIYRPLICDPVQVPRRGAGDEGS